MKRNVLFILAVLMVFSFGLANAQDINVSSSSVWDSGTKIAPGPVTFVVNINTTSCGLYGSTNGFRVFLSSDGTVGGLMDPGPGFGAVVGANNAAIAGDPFPEYATYTVQAFGADGSGADTVGFGGVSFGDAQVYENVDVWDITTSVDSLPDTWLCIDSSFFPPGGAWLWSLGDCAGGNTSINPPYHGPYCYLIEQPPNLPATFDECLSSLTITDHCATYTHQFTATDPDPEQCDPPGTGAVSFSMVDAGGSGATITTGGMLSVAGSSALAAGSPYSLTIHVEDACGAGSDCTFDLIVDNNAPTIDCGSGAIVGKGNPIDPYQVTGNDADGCDGLTYSVSAVTTPAGSFSIDPSTGVFNYTADESDVGTQTFEACVTDGLEEVCCQFDVEVLATEPWEIQIEKTHGTYQGGHELVNVCVNKGSEQMWGFDLLIAYDASALSFQTALEGDIYASCGWEYFTYRYGANGNCSNACPSGLLRIVGLAETNNGPNHPTCFGPTPFCLATLDFLVTDDHTFECQYVPIRFFWTDCGDNAISYHEVADEANPYSQTLGISRFVYDFEGMEITGEGEFPTYFGAPTSPCMEGDKDVPTRFVDFINGGVDIICGDSIDDRGDLNLNGIANEIADAVLYTNYFVYGIGVFEHYQAQVAASDVNADGLTLSVADLVYQIRIIVGDALPYPKLNPVTADIKVGTSVSVDQPMGAAFVVIEGNAAPELLANNMDLKYSYDAENNVTRALVYSFDPNQTFSGEFLNANGTVKSVEMATYEGARVETVVVPNNYALHQNYPNPFNPSTVVSFDLPSSADYTLTVYNITGQEIANYSDHAEPGTVTVNIDGSAWASGVYFYKLNAGDFSKTLKMVLVK